MSIFSGSASKKLAGKIAKNLGLELSPVEIFVFPDGEKRIRIKENVVGKDCIIIQSASIPPDENYMELFIMIDALKRSGAKSIKTVIPYLGYQRQDHIFRDGEAVSLEVIAEILTRVGMTELFSFDLHSPKIPDIFSVPVHHLSALPTFAERIKQDFNLTEIVLVSPDMGGIRRVKEVAEILGNIPFVTIEKNRNLASGEINDSGLNGEVRGKIAVVVDDMISTGQTVVEAAELLIEQGATKVFAFATHAVLAKDADKLLQHSNLERVVVSDTIDVPAFKLFPKLEIISIADVAAKSLKS
ncbi:MAG TPA: ribose-phosphate pyrophosphokinase [Patescibacteria group bacterium]|jgi:ribose-phosphate pyrophosphokinase|nr:ribose-phosphate pyrophosphokinase [Patescibacteria group bacterium]